MAKEQITAVDAASVARLLGGGDRKSMRQSKLRLVSNANATEKHAPEPRTETNFSFLFQRLFGRLLEGSATLSRLLRYQGARSAISYGPGALRSLQASALRQCGDVA